MFFVIELRTDRTDNSFGAWWEFERHPALWTARNRCKAMIEDDPRRKGHIRIVASRPLSNVVDGDGD